MNIKIPLYDNYNMTEPILNMQYRGEWYSYAPKENITTYELAKLHQLITVITVSPISSDSRNDYMDKYNLMRHFDKNE
jgi:hypothetical protein